MKTRPHIFDISRPKARHGHKYTKYEMCLSMMMVIKLEAQFMKQLSNFEAVLKKSGTYKKSVQLQQDQNFCSRQREVRDKDFGDREMELRCIWWKCLRDQRSSLRQRDVRHRGQPRQRESTVCQKY